MIKAVIFDVDGVLIDSMDANIKFFQDLLAASGYKKPSKPEASKVFHLTMLDAIKFLTKEKSDEKIKEVWDLGHRLSYPTELWKFPKDSNEVVKSLKQKYKLAIVTSRIKRGIDSFFKASNLEKYFDVVVSFEDYSNPKPHPEPLLVATKKLKVKPEEAVYIGDMETDMKAAKTAGVKFILYSRKKMKGADVSVGSFREIPSAILKL